VYAGGHSAHAGCCDDGDALKAQLSAFLHVKTVLTVCHELNNTCRFTRSHDTVWHTYTKVTMLMCVYTAVLHAYRAKI
jgi:hypothetical protein